MKHLAKIQHEFLKMSSWDALSYEVQKKYLQEHPKSNRKITAQPISIEKLDKDAEMFANHKPGMTKTDLLNLQAELRAEKNRMKDDDSRWDNYNKALMNIGLVLTKKNIEKKRPTLGPGIMPIWIGGKRVR